MQEISWSFIEEFVLTICANVSSELDSEIIEYVEYYIDHNEYEMAFEILFLEIIKQNAKITDNNLLKQSFSIGEYLKLDKETIYDPDFWNKFITYIN